MTSSGTHSASYSISTRALSPGVKWLGPKLSITPCNTKAGWLEPYLHFIICFNGMYRNIFTFLSLQCVAVLAVPLYHFASVYAWCVHAKDETPESPMLFVQFQRQSILLSVLSGENCMEIVANFHTHVICSFITQHRLTTMPLNICTFSVFESFTNQNTANLFRGESQYSCSWTDRLTNNYLIFGSL